MNINDGERCASVRHANDLKRLEKAARGQKEKSTRIVSEAKENPTPRRRIKSRNEMRLIMMMVSGAELKGGGNHEAGNKPGDSVKPSAVGGRFGITGGVALYKIVRFQCSVTYKFRQLVAVELLIRIRFQHERLFFFRRAV